MFVRELAAISTEEAALRLHARPGFVWLDADGSGTDGRFSFCGSDPLAVRRAQTAAERCALLDELSASQDADTSHATQLDAHEVADEAVPERCVPRWVGYLAYAPQPATSGEPPLPAACFARYDAWLAVDHTTQRAYLVGDDAAACARLAARLAVPNVRGAAGARMGRVEVTARTAHAAAIATAQAHIAAGDIYQVNLARMFWAPYDGDALALGLAMRAHSPVPLGFYFSEPCDDVAASVDSAAGTRTIIARSMERFLRFERDSRAVITRPIKGTLARAGRDQAEALALQADPKERAEHSMIVDLMRNDLSRIAEVGSVRVPQIMTVEPYAKLSHLVSTVTGKARADVSAGAIIAATFPPGSVTGAPKLRATQIIAALETEPRGVYTGAVGYVDRRGGLSLAVAIRTATIAGGRVRYFAGGGIVEASDPLREVAETELKARVFLDAAATLGASYEHG